MSTQEEIRATVQQALTEALAGLWNAATDPALVERLASDIAEQKVLAAAALAAGDQAKHALHQGNVRHLLATVESEATTRYLKAYKHGLSAFTGAIQALIGVLVHATLV